MKAIAWGLTGAGALLEESVETIETLTARGVRVTAFVSRAGEQVLTLYGLRDRLEKALRGDYPVGVVYESREKPGFPTIGRLYLGVYSAVVVAPATLNTVAKIVHGVADTLVSNLAVHGVKAGLPVYILPVDLYEVKSKIPVYIDRSKCIKCGECVATRSCPTGALVLHPYYRVVIDLEKCTRCYACIDSCPYSAIAFNVEITVKPVPYYVDVIKRLELIPGVHVLRHPREVLEFVAASP